jgi:uncharacterized phage protein (TIGR01671 family)
MNREFKFRVWHNPLQRMFYSDSQEDAIFWGAKVGGSALGTFVHTFMNLFVDKSRQLMQYTGLKDKNGKEIYEGDIVRRGGESIPEGEWGIVEYTGCSFGLNREIFIKKTGGAQFIDYPEQYFDNDFNWCEVIGNIFENPEFLKEA